ncbi:succinyl-diaminopimelate desuccinylase [Buchnera aphidicola (Cinara tujafilina)]|uniref:Succinyl-diaminopimelate desuccinylase n=1 Tax=Buchnera aphidicola (Cinara tujafilina) TaxID=261317 RepID=F7WZ02_9GAMM|nr:succinyl-diaminopimelate desuccinylase [Buchnera aphidicola]AEH39652.1 succinyl-diaminopimelate desuccinylase [Buchnera aphidicola (Cinara tujafilina)]
MHSSTLKLAQELINIPSISPNDLGCQDILIQRLLRCGFTVELINLKDTKNFWAWKGVGGKTLSFAGHTDVVPAGSIKKWNFPPFCATIKDGFLFGRGAADMKGALSAMVVAVEKFLIKKPIYSGRISFLITSDEESSGKYGTKHVVSVLKNRKELIDYCIIGEPTSEYVLGDCIKNGRRGSMSAKLTIYGVQGHIAYPHLAINPIHQSLPFLSELSKLSLDHGNSFFLPSQIQISNIQISKKYSSNMIPGSLNIEFNIRFNGILIDQKIQEIILELLKKYLLNYSIKWTIHAQPFYSNTNFLSKIVSESIFFNNNIIPNVNTSGGTSDGRFICNIANEIIELGLENCTIHKINECISIKNLHLLQKIYERILDNIFR